MLATHVTDLERIKAAIIADPQAQGSEEASMACGYLHDAIGLLHVAASRFPAPPAGEDPRVAQLEAQVAALTAAISNNSPAPDPVTERGVDHDVVESGYLHMFSDVVESPPPLSEELEHAVPNPPASAIDETDVAQLQEKIKNATQGTATTLPSASPEDWPDQAPLGDPEDVRREQAAHAAFKRTDRTGMDGVDPRAGN